MIRRATELAAAERDAGEGRLSEGEVYRIAHEVGLTERHVRSALDEMRGPGRGRASALDRLYGPATVRSSRVVGGTIPLLTDQIDEFLVASQLLQRVRRTSDFLMYQPSLDWASQLARMASFSSREHYIASAKSVEVRFDGVDSGRTLIEFFVDPGARDEEILGAAFGGGAAGGSCGLGVGLVASLVVLHCSPWALESSWAWASGSASVSQLVAGIGRGLPRCVPKSKAFWIIWRMDGRSSRRRRPGGVGSNGSSMGWLVI